jgi:hypothetical protein
MIRIAILLSFFSTSLFAQDNTELARRIDILSDEINQLKAHQAYISQNKSIYGLGRSASKVYFIPQGLSIGAYGEIVYNHPAGEDQDGDAVDQDPTLEALRYVVYLGYKFSDKWIFNSEIEIEHVNEIYNEFMYLDYLHEESLNFRAGLVLIPAGFVNEQHEPVLFGSVFRPDVEKKIIPSTWREIGVGAFGASGKLTYKAYLVNGGNADGSDGNGIRAEKGFRDTRKKGGSGNSDENQRASTGAVALRADYNYAANSLAGLTLYTGQASSALSENLQTTLYDLHIQHTINNLQLRLLYTHLSYANVDAWNEVATNKLPSELLGGYFEALYKINIKDYVLEPFVRYEKLNLNHKYEEDDYDYDGALDYHITRLGIAYKPISQVTFKADYGIKNNRDNDAVNEFNIGLGFNF